MKINQWHLNLSIKENFWNCINNLKLRVNAAGKKCLRNHRVHIVIVSHCLVYLHHCLAFAYFIIGSC